MCWFNGALVCQMIQVKITTMWPISTHFKTVVALWVHSIQPGMIVLMVTHDANIIFSLLFRIFVNMDDNIIKHYSNQSAFLIETTQVSAGQFQITLTELWGRPSYEVVQSLKLTILHNLFLLALPDHKHCRLDQDQDLNQTFQGELDWIHWIY
jgi:hypothetical protein